MAPYPDISVKDILKTLQWHPARLRRIAQKAGIAFSELREHEKHTCYRAPVSLAGKYHGRCSLDALARAEAEFARLPLSQARAIADKPLVARPYGLVEDADMEFVAPVDAWVAA